MDHHKILYKDQRSHTPGQNKKENRKMLEANRAKHRRDRFQTSRNIFTSPSQPLQEIIIPICPENLDDKNQEQNPNSTRLAKIICNNTTNPEKLTKQEVFIKRFVEWKETKKNTKKPEKKKPFVVASLNSGRQTTTSSSIVPRGHPKEFRPPTGLKTIQMKKVETSENTAIKGRRSVYTIIPTPPRKQMNEKFTNKNPYAKNALPTSLHAKILSTNKKEKDAVSLSGSSSKPTISKNLNGKTMADLKKVNGVRTSSLSTVNNLAKTLEKVNTNIDKSAQQPVREKLRPRALRMPPPQPPIRPVGTAISTSAGAAGKIRSMAHKNVGTVKVKKNSPLKAGGARLANNLKAKKQLNNKKANLSVLKLNNKKIKSLLEDIQGNENMIIQTPRDFATLNPYAEFVTSTKLKDSSQTIKDDCIFPVETFPKKSHSNSSAKRNILVEETNENSAKATKSDCPQNVKKFNFIRYSEVDKSPDNDIYNDKVQKGANETIFLTDVNDKTLVQTPAIDEKTPTKFGPDERPANYLSPFVSVARGKVSSKKEKEKRNSIYLQSGHPEPNESGSGGNALNSSICYVEVRRTLEAVRYFRNQLQNEIDRLHQLCDDWESYKTDNLETIQNANGEDMINVTIGQTRLLTSKKFMQFKGLIDRCEAGAAGIGVAEYDGSEGTRPITSVDLEGFWSMLGLQVDNLDKRFENLNRWKENGWMDPDEVRPKKKNNLTKVKKTRVAPAATSKPNSALQQMLRKMKAEMRKNKNKNEDINEMVLFTSSTQTQRRSTGSNNSTPRKSVGSSSSQRLSITVKDRKYFSPAATVISFSSNRRASLRRKSSQDSPKLTKHIQKFNEALESSFELRKSVLMIENSRRMSLNIQSPITSMKKNDRKATLDSVSVKSEENAVDSVKTLNQKCLSPQSPTRTPVPIGHKSILKTPGTAKSRLRNVIFNEKLRVKKFNFLINDSLNAENGDDNNSHEEDLAKNCEDTPERTLTLRNRKVRLRPSCEIVIPRD